ncbi:MAG: thiamine phosphate synthase [Acidobacteriota bacterium]
MPAPTFDLLAISDLPSLAEPFTEWLRRLSEAGVRALQVREKTLDDRAVLELAREARAVLPVVLVNGRLDIALAAGGIGGIGAHLPADGVPIGALRRRFGEGVMLGRSTHTVEEVEAALREGADYAVFGPVYPTPSKERFGLPRGLEELARAARLPIPVYALGGVTLSRFGELAQTGAAGVAGIRLFQEPDLTEIARRARRFFPKP